MVIWKGKATMTQQFEAMREILHKAYQIEIDGYTFYTMAADKADKPTVQKLFARLAADESKHKAYLKNVMRNYEELGAGSFFIDPKTPDLGEYSSQVFTDEFRREAQGADFELGVLSTGVMLETNAVELFSAMARDEKDPRVSGFFRFLADWEDQHLRTLQRLYESVKLDFRSEG